MAMTYKETIAQAMTEIGKDPIVQFCGYNTKFGKAAGTLNGVPEDQLNEFPLAENLMMGAAIGMSLDGWMPVVYFERMDFVLIALDAIVNHLDKLSELSEGIHKPVSIIRCVVGNSKTPLFTGATHTQNFSKAIREMVSFQVIELTEKERIVPAYEEAHKNAKMFVSTMLVEFKDLYET